VSTQHTTADIHQEKVFEEHIVESLCSGLGYVERSCEEHYDVGYALDTALLFQLLLSPMRGRPWKSTTALRQNRRF
jgi:type I restriction enzyme R subunit